MLEDKIQEINTKILDKIGSTSKLFGLVFQVRKGNETINTDTKGNTVFYDDSYSFYGYHRQVSEEQNELPARGKISEYNTVNTIELICFAKELRSKEYVQSVLKKIRQVTLVRITTLSEGANISEEETGRSDYDFTTVYPFKITYTITIKTNNCAVPCQN